MSSLTQFVSSSRIKSIQRGIITISPAQTSATATISSIDPSKSILYHLGVDTSVSDRVTDFITRSAYLTLTNSTTITATTNASGVSNLIVSWQIVEYY